MNYPAEGLITMRHNQPYRFSIWHPFRWLNGVRHRGIDIANKRNTPIKAVMEEKIIKFSTQGTYGNHIWTESTDGQYRFLYAHLDHWAAYVRKGKVIKKGEVFAWMGSTGTATGSHLHWECHIRVAGGYSPIDPLNLARNNSDATERLLKRVNQAFRMTFKREPTPDESDYWQRRIVTSDKRRKITDYDDLIEAMDYWRSRGKTRGK